MNFITYCIAWKDKKNVFIVADSAVSSTDNTNEIESTSFGDLHEKKGDYYVFEGAFKMQTINNSFLISYAGNMMHIDEVYDLLHLQLTAGIEIETAFQYIANSISYKDIDIIVGYIDNGLPKLFHYDGTNCFEKEFVQIGSGVSKESWTFRNEFLLNENKNHRTSATQALTSMIVVMQIYSLKERIIDIGVGGLIFGARIDSEGIHWCKDLTYYIYNSSLMDYQLITVLERNNNVHVLSGFNSKHIVFSSKDNALTNNELEDNYSESLHESRTEYFVFASMFNPSVILLQINMEIHNEYFRMYYCRDGIYTHYRFIFTPELIGLINGDSFLKDELVFFQWEYARALNYKSRKDVIIENGHQEVVEDYNDNRFI